MLQQVQLRGINCFGGEGVTLGPLAPVNLLFGPNGSGKTSISRALHDPESFPLTHIEEVGSSCEIHVYNRDYVSRTFGTSSSLPGIFMLGSNAQELLDQIEATKGLYAKMEADWATTNSLLHGDDSNTGELARLQSIEAEYLDAAWKARDSVPPEIDEVIRAGTRKNKKGFLAKCEQVADEFSSSDLKLDDLVEDAKSLFDPATKPTELIPEFSGRPPQHAKAKALLGKRILASSESPLSDLVVKLENQAWVQQGIQHYNNAEGVCPFCQQDAPLELAGELSELFDSTYQEEKSDVERLVTEAKIYQTSVDSFIEAHSKTISGTLGTSFDASIFDIVKAHASAIVRACEDKLKDLASVVNLEDYEGREALLSEAVASANGKISAANLLLANREEQAKELSRRCWVAFVRDTLAVETSVYVSDRDSQKERISALRTQLDVERKGLEEIARKLTGLQYQTRTSRKVLEEINRLLKRVGFRSFELVPAADSELEGAYRIVRPGDGALADVKDLSEGERTFITFLYYFHAVQSLAEGGNQAPVVAVIDDPISSLDSDIMFIVSSLVRTMCDDVRAREGRVAQLVLMTHNTSFHREISEHFSFDSWKKKGSNNIAYFRLKKTISGVSELLPYGKTDPVRSIYQTLWDEVALAVEVPDDMSTTLPNAMRRILETYVEMVGGINKKKIQDLFPEDERLLCRSLLAWTNAGSHRLLDDSGWETSVRQNSVWIDTFHKIFVYANHESHYEKMMNKAVE